MGNGLLIYMIEDGRQCNEANRATSIGKRHTDCPPDTDLRQLLHVKDNVVLMVFFEHVGLSMRVEIAGLTALKQETFPRFTTLSIFCPDLASWGLTQPLSLLCYVQLSYPAS